MARSVNALRSCPRWTWLHRACTAWYSPHCRSGLLAASASIILTVDMSHSAEFRFACVARNNFRERPPSEARDHDPCRGAPAAERTVEHARKRFVLAVARPHRLCVGGGAARCGGGSGSGGSGGGKTRWVRVREVLASPGRWCQNPIRWATARLLSARGCTARGALCAGGRPISTVVLQRVQTEHTEYGGARSFCGQLTARHLEQFIHLPRCEDARGRDILLWREGAEDRHG
eukprot:1661105-Prymnesium_polylepis.1